eukprot:Nitzschia sp. Nitz4//scaffold3_size479765//313073//314488//NITZ4_000129-RA/size479765-processed-gene-1.309-mRNA-1//-1//CDS//3329550845//9084//frame0
MAALPDIGKESHEGDLTTVSSCLCPNCEGGNAETRLLNTCIPGAKETIVISLVCPDCNYRNADANFAGEIQPKGISINFTVSTRRDLDRQVVKSDYCTISFPALDLEIPAATQKGHLTTIQGLLTRTRDDLSNLQAERVKLLDWDNFYRCQGVIDKIETIVSHSPDIPFVPFQMVLDDPSGNSSIENPKAPKSDKTMIVLMYERDATQNEFLGIPHSSVAKKHVGPVDLETTQTYYASIECEEFGGIDKHDIASMYMKCPHCLGSAELTSCIATIPHFKEIVLIVMQCDGCGYRTSELKGGGPIPPLGSKLALVVNGPEDLNREVLKSDSAGVVIPDIDLELDGGGLGGLYTTVEGLLDKIFQQLSDSNPFLIGDSVMKQHNENDGVNFPPPTNTAFTVFLKSLENIKNGNKFPFSLVIVDPLDNSFIGPAKGAKTSDTGNDVSVTPFQRSPEQNEMLGLNDICTQNSQLH